VRALFFSYSSSESGITMSEVNRQTMLTIEEIELIKDELTLDSDSKATQALRKLYDLYLEFRRRALEAEANLQTSDREYDRAIAALQRRIRDLTGKE
jgi:hypothetical protein